MVYSQKKIESIENGLHVKSTDDRDTIRSVQELMRETNTLGLSVAIVEGNQIVLEKGYGITDRGSGRVVTPKTLFQAASISKALTALAVMILVERGDLRLDKNVNAYLESWKLPESRLTVDRPVTLKNLLSHTAGVNVSGFPGYMKELEIPSLTQVLNGDGGANTDPINVDTIPDEICRYSGGGTTIVQQVLIDTQGQPYQDLMQELILGPLGMKNSFFSNEKLPAEAEELIALGYHFNGNQVEGGYRVHPEMAAAGLWTTAGDLAKFSIGVQKAIKGEQGAILSKTYTDLMLTPILDGKFNIGFFNQVIGQEELIGHDGGNSGYDSSVLFHKYKGYGFAFLANSNNGHQIFEPYLKSVAAVNGWVDLLPVNQ